MKKSTKLFISNFFYLILTINVLFNTTAFAGEKITEQNQSINKSNTANTGDIIIKKWADDKKSAFSFSFDDAYMSHYTNTAPILNQFGFQGTFFLLAGSVHDNTPEWRYGLWWQFLEMAQDGHEMAAHTMTHPHLKDLPIGDEQTPHTITYELYQSKTLVEQKIGEDVISFAYPYSQHNTKVDNVAAIYFESGRAIDVSPNSSSLTGAEWYSLTSKQPEFDLPRITQSDDLDELVDYKNFTQNSINNGKWTIFQGHEVLPFSEIPNAVSQGIYLPISNEWLTDLAGWIKNKSDNDDLWVETIGNVTRYIKERDNFYFSVVSNSGDQITIDVGDGLDDNIFDYPLTADIVVPSSWGDVIFTQGNVTQTLTPFLSNGVNYVRVDIDPSAGNVKLQDSASLFTITSSAGTGGSITPLGQTSVSTGGSQLFTITPNTGFEIATITVDGHPETVTTPSGQSYTFTNVTSDHSISATFTNVQFTITSSASANGAINPNGSVLVNSGSDKTFTITPNSGYIIASITVDGNPETVTTPSGQTYTFTNITTDHTISAAFVVDITYYTFSGKILYDNVSSSPFQNTTITLTSVDTTVEATTNAAGGFSFNSLPPGTYQISLTTTNNWGGVNATDALKTLRVFANLDTFTALQNKAGDVNDDGSINSIDALLIAKRFTGIISSFTVQDWVYNAPISITISNQNETMDIKTLACGDVDGSLNP